MRNLCAFEACNQASLLTREPLFSSFRGRRAHGRSPRAMLLACDDLVPALLRVSRDAACAVLAVEALWALAWHSGATERARLGLAVSATLPRWLTDPALHAGATALAALCDNSTSNRGP